MGTKIEYSRNLLATSVDTTKKFTVDGVDFWDHSQNIGLRNKNHCSIGNNKLQDLPMDKVLDRTNIELIKKTMQMHEDIFKHQVKELHRVYSVQKMMMAELHKETRPNKFLTPTNSIGISHLHLTQQHHQTTTQTSYIPDFQLQSSREECQCSKERSGSCSGETNMKTQKTFFDLERPQHGCELSTDIGGYDEDMEEVDLTLSIGGSQVEKKKKKKKSSYVIPLQLGCSHSSNGKIREINYSSVSFQSDRLGDCMSDPTTPISSSSVTFDQERKGAYWLSQVLKLN